MRNKWWWVAVGLPVLLVAIYLAMPWYSAHKLIEAAQHQDLETMERYVDFPQLRGNIRERLLEEVRVSMGRDLSPELGSIFSAGAELFIGPLVDSLVSPRGISELIQGQKDWKEFERELQGAFGGNRTPAPEPPTETAKQESEHEHHWRLRHWRFSGLNTVEVFCGNRQDTSEVVLYLQRNGLHWQLVDMHLIDRKVD